jgi:hypothetical protein
MHPHLTRRDFGRGRQQRSQILLDPIGCHPVRFFRPGLRLKDADGGHHPISGIDSIVSRKTCSLADDEHKTLLHLPHQLVYRAGIHFVPSNTGVHDLLLSFLSINGFRLE